ncbi:hypothetical protein [Methanomassiliicoccus luminyensis]|jgi:hypothetical protein|uniref:hypothetical protein n=1 Tax=Methanomassiliicoccus luminyensis TaxID=1080712 RepID=UPI0003818212|nr:hypothetical protein [Methanomassiliicoccus luminyensis]
MSSDPDVAYPPRDVAFQTAEDLAAHILENANSYHVLGEADRYSGQDRMRFAILLAMFEEMGKLMDLVRECEKAAKADYESVRVEDFHDHCLKGRRAVAQIMEEIRTVEKASLNLGKKMELKMTEEPAFLREEFCTLPDRVIHFELDRNGRGLDFIPSPELMDRLAAVVERNALAAGEYIHDLGKALGLWLDLGLKRKKDVPEGVIRYV